MVKQVVRHINPQYVYECEDNDGDSLGFYICDSLDDAGHFTLERAAEAAQCYLNTVIKEDLKGNWLVMIIKELGEKE